MSVRSRVRRQKPEAPELNITAFLNLMVILVPFLLITAVFSQMTILELNLPPQTKADKQKQKELKKVRNFELIIRKNEMTLADTIGGPIKTFSKGKEFNMKALSKLLVLVKSKFPDKKNLSILMEPNVPYDVLVQAMDTVRIVEQEEEGVMVQKELFPIISIGDAPAP